MKHLSEEQKAKTAERREKFRTLCKRVANMSEAEKAALQEKMQGIVTCEGHALSAHNACLVMLQAPEATIVGGFRQWLKQGRVPAKGSHSIAIWIPTSRKTEGDETGDGEDTTKTGFIVGSVFDISQTIEMDRVESAETVQSCGA